MKYKIRKLHKTKKLHQKQKILSHNAIRKPNTLHANFKNKININYKHKSI